MPDVVELLRAAAGVPPTEVDLGELERQVGARRVQRHAVIAASAAGALVAGLLVLTAQSGGDKEELKVVTPPDRTTSPRPAVGPPSERPQGSVPPHLGAGPFASNAPEPTTAPTAADPSPAASPEAPTASPEAPTPAVGYPPAAGCSVESTPTAPSAFCSFTASEVAGWLFAERGGVSVTSPTVSYTVSITRNGRTTVHRNGEERCGTREILPGDQVRLQIDQTEQVGANDFYDLQAGPSEGC
ncbi:MAG: hypothetical protein M3P04_07740 [Actinomycetota bacterium]|nr:hypothetical protein [Actinomycetota bacterium]